MMYFIRVFALYKMLDNESRVHEKSESGVHEKSDARKCSKCAKWELYVCRVYNVFVISKRVKSDF